MAYLKDIKLCIDCEFFGTPHGQRDRCLNPKLTVFNPVDGKEEYPLCYSERTSWNERSCGNKAQYFILNYEAAIEQEKRRQEFEEAMRDAPSL